jgi:hypothetical protein
MTPRFNENRPFGEIKPPTNGAFYEQDGCFFDQFKGFLGDNFDTLGSTGAAKSAPATKAKNPPKAKETPPAPVADEDDEDEGKGELDLAGWAKGEEKYGFFSVKAAIKKILPDADASNTKLAKTALVEAGIVSFDDVKW